MWQAGYITNVLPQPGAEAIKGKEGSLAKYTDVKVGTPQGGGAVRLYNYDIQTLGSLVHIYYWLIYT